MAASPVALITGGEGDLARAVKSVLESAGWTVHAPGRNDLDVANPESVRQFFQPLDQLELLVTTAGIRRDAPFLTQSEADRNAVIDVCLRGSFLCAREAGRIMVRQEAGHIVFIGSHAAVLGTAGQTAYAAAKAGLGGLTRSLAAELGDHRIRVNCVLPGWMETKFTADIPHHARERARESEALGAFATPNDAARFILNLHRMPAISGQVFHLDSRITRGPA